MKYEVAGDPVSGLRWTRKTTKKIAAELSALGIRVSRKTVAKLLKQMNFSLRTNKKKISNGSPPTRDAQFANITQLRERFSRRGNPILIFPRDGTELRASNREKSAHRGLLFLCRLVVVYVESFAAPTTFSRPRLARYCNKNRFRIQ